jgi:succinoglycan biosynthesis protein ExoH
MIYVHPGFYFNGATLQTGPAAMAVYDFLSNYLGRGSVPLLSIISGFLAVSSFERRSSTSFLIGRVKTLIGPYILWSLAYIMLLFLLSFISSNFDSFSARVCTSDALTNCLNAVFGIWSAPVNFPLYFIREIFFASVLLPLVYFPIGRRSPMVLLVLSFILFFAPNSLFYPQGDSGLAPFWNLTIQGAFAFGVFLKIKFGIDGLTTFSARFTSKRILSITFIVSIVIFFFDFGKTAFAELVQARVFRLFLVCVFWCICYRISSSSAGRWMGKFALLSFWAYCSHLLTNICLSYLGGMSTNWKPNLSFSFILLLTSPLVAYFCAWMIAQVTSHSKSLSMVVFVLNGSRALSWSVISPKNS